MLLTSGLWVWSDFPFPLTLLERKTDIWECWHTIKLRRKSRCTRVLCVCASVCMLAFFVFSLTTSKNYNLRFQFLWHFCVCILSFFSFNNIIFDVPMVFAYVKIYKFNKKESKYAAKHFYSSDVTGTRSRSWFSGNNETDWGLNKK